MKSHKLRFALAIAIFFVISLLFFYPRYNPLVCSSDITVKNTKSATLFYPCSISKPLPATTLTSGYGGKHWVLNWLSQLMAENGFVVLALTPVHIFGKNTEWRDAHLSGIAEFEKLNNLPNSPLYQKIDLTRLQVCGHSKGGGGALMASNQLGYQLKSTIVMAPWHEQFDNLDGITSATLFQTGEKDINVTQEMAMNEFTMLPENINKAYFEYASAHHFSWGVLNLRQLRGIIGTDILAWMKYYLKDEANTAPILLGHTKKSKHLWVNVGISHTISSL